MSEAEIKLLQQRIREAKIPQRKRNTFRLLTWNIRNFHGRKENMAKHHGVSPDKFLLYIKEMEWRYNHRDCDLFDLLLQYMLGIEYT